MADTMRWRYGETNSMLMAVDAATVVEIGDLLYLATDDVRPAATQADQGTESGNQDLFHDLFAGVAMQRSRNGDSNPIRVATTGVFEFDCASATFEIGAHIGAAENGAGTALLNQTVKGVGGATISLGRCAKRVPTAGTKVLVDIVSTVAHGGPQAAM